MEKIKKEKIIEYFENIPYYRLKEEIDEIFPKNNPYKKRIRELEFKISDLEDEVFDLSH